jgi:hypothetical protein
VNTRDRTWRDLVRRRLWTSVAVLLLLVAALAGGCGAGAHTATTSAADYVGLWYARDADNEIWIKIAAAGEEYKIKWVALKVDGTPVTPVLPVQYAAVKSGSLVVSADRSFSLSTWTYTLSDDRKHLGLASDFGSSASPQPFSASMSRGTKADYAAFLDRVMARVKATD